MKLKTYDAPHIRHPEKTRTLMTDAVLAMLFLYGMAYYYYGARTLLLGLASVAAAVVSELVCTLLSRRKINFRDISPMVTGMLIPLLMPASIDYRVVVTAAVFGIVVAKHPFGGTGNNVFNPAAAGFAFSIICFSDRLFAYPLPLTKLPVIGPVEVSLTTSPVFTLSLGGLPSYEPVEMLLGNYPGPMGATNILVLVACLLFLVFRGTVHWETPVFFFASAALMVFLFPRGGPELGLDIMMRLRLTAYELMSGCLLVGGIFLLGDPVTTPKRYWSRMAYGLVAGVVVMLFRRYGGFEEEIPFAVLLMNASVWGFDMLGEQLASRLRHRRALKTG